MYLNLLKQDVIFMSFFIDFAIKTKDISFNECVSVIHIDAVGAVKIKS